MSKKKRSKDEWVNFVRKIFSHNRAKRSCPLPVDYITSVSDQLWRINPSKEIVFNTLSEFYTVAFEKGFTYKSECSIWFKARQQKALDDAFNDFRDSLDDLIHNTNEQPK